MKLIIASNNKGKIREYKDIFEPFGFLVRSQGESYQMTAVWKWKP